MIGQVRSKLGLHAAAVQIPIGLSANFEALIDLVEMKAYRFEGPDGEKPVEFEIPAEYKERAHKARQDLLANIGEVDDEIMECVVEEKGKAYPLLNPSFRALGRGPQGRHPPDLHCPQIHSSLHGLSLQEQGSPAAP